VLGIHSEIPRQIRSTDYGHFGLGTSSFMVAQKVEIDTLSYKEGSEAVHWSCDGSPEFRLEDSPERARAPPSTLQEEEQEYLERASASW